MLKRRCAISCLVATNKETYGGSSEDLKSLTILFVTKKRRVSEASKNIYSVLVRDYLPSLSLKSLLNVVLQTLQVASTLLKKQT